MYAAKEDKKSRMARAKKNLKKNAVNCCFVRTIHIFAPPKGEKVL